MQITEQFELSDTEKICSALTLFSFLRHSNILPLHTKAEAQLNSVGCVTNTST